MAHWTNLIKRTLNPTDQGLLIYQQGTEISYDDILIDLVA
jgi:hypothetical protein